MQIKFTDNYLTFIREENDPKFYGIQNAKGESNLLHYLKGELNKLGFKLVKKRMWKDGHLVDDMQQYLTTQNHRASAPHIYLYNSRWSIAGLEEDWNKGQVDVCIDYDIFDKQPNCKVLVRKLLEVQA